MSTVNGVIDGRIPEIETSYATRFRSVYAASNAALLYAQLGDEDRAIKELQNVARKAGGSIDMRAALAAIHW